MRKEVRTFFRTSRDETILIPFEAICNVVSLDGFGIPFGRMSLLRQMIFVSGTASSGEKMESNVNFSHGLRYGFSIIAFFGRIFDRCPSLYSLIYSTQKPKATKINN